jgi:hypothetical protein
MDGWLAATEGMDQDGWWRRRVWLVETEGRIFIGNGRMGMVLAY